jgi:glycosyltransferase involved in cell wall biosynthesis
MNPPIPLSVAIITRDEAENLPGCLQSVAFADQIVVVDSGSRDETVPIAAAAGCDVFSEAWCGFGPQKQLAVDRCRNDWVLILDADERLPPETAAAIQKIVGSPPEADGYSFPRKNYFQGRWIRHAGWWPDRVVRLFRKDRGCLTPASVHESVEVRGAVVSLTVPIEHFTESRFSELLQKIDRYSTLGAQEAFAAGRTATVWGAAVRAKLTFLHNYVIRLGFLDGPQGFTLAITDGVNKFCKYAKLAELSKERRATAASAKE